MEIHWKLATLKPQTTLNPKPISIYIHIYIYTTPPFTDPFAVSPAFLLFSQLETTWQFVFFVFFGTSSGLGTILTSRHCFFWYLLRFWQYFPRKPCKNLRRYQNIKVVAARHLETSKVLLLLCFWSLVRLWQYSKNVSLTVGFLYF